jgi:hypothetical protein
MVRRLALVALALASSCFRGNFLEGTVCDDDRQCAPHFVCDKDGSTSSGGSSGAAQGVCKVPDNSPHGTSSGSSTSGTTTGETSTTG